MLGLFTDISKNATVHIKNVSIDEVRGIGGQEYGGANQVIRLAPTACGGLGDDELVEGMATAISLPLTQRCGLVGFNVTWSDAVTLNVVTTELGTDVPGQHF